MTNVVPILFAGGVAEATQEKVYHPNDSIVANSTNCFGKKYAKIPTSEIFIDPQYQRIQTESKVRELVRNWNEDLYEPIKVTYRDNKFFANDGGKRLRAQIAMGRRDVVCEICDENTIHAEAARYINQAKYVTRFRPKDTFKANLLLGDTVDTTLKAVCDEFCVSLPLDDSRDATGAVTNLSVVRNIIRVLGEGGLRWIFSIIRDCGWENAKRGYDRNIIEALKFIYMTYSDNLDAVASVITGYFTSNNIMPLTFKSTSVKNYPDISAPKAMRNELCKIVEQTR